MHELSLCEAIAGVVLQHAGERQVERVVVRIGQLRQVVPDALTFSWGILASSQGLDGCALEVEMVPATVACNACGRETTLDAPILGCAECYSRDVKLLSGEEFAVVSLEMAGS